MLELIETKCYRTKVGLFIQEYGRNCTLFDCEKMLLPGAEVFYDQCTPEGWHIFTVLDPEPENHNRYYVKVPDYDVEEEIEEIE